VSLSDTSNPTNGDARGLAEMVCVGWFKAVQVKSMPSHERKALLTVRHQLVDMRVRIDNQLWDILKTFGLVIGKCSRGQIGQRAQELSKGSPGVDSIVASMVAVRDSLLEQITGCDRTIRRLAKKNDMARRLMTVPGVGPVVALAYIFVIDDPRRFPHSCDVGAYLGLTPKRYQSGEVDQAGRISKCGDGFARSCLYEAAGVLLTRVDRWSPLKAWGVRLMKRLGATKAKVTVAQTGGDPAPDLDRWYRVPMDERRCSGLIVRPPPSSARAGTLSLPGRRVEMTAHHALFAGTTIAEQFASSHCGVTAP
jgi:transposase